MIEKKFLDYDRLLKVEDRDKNSLNYIIEEIKHINDDDKPLIRMKFNGLNAKIKDAFTHVKSNVFYSV